MSSKKETKNKLVSRLTTWELQILSYMVGILEIFIAQCVHGEMGTGL